MSIEVFPHLKFESLVAAVQTIPLPEGPRLQKVVIPSLSFADHMRRRLTDSRGICMGYDFITPQGFIHDCIGPGKDSPWAIHNLCWEVLPHVKRFSGYLGVNDPSSRDRFALAQALADRLDQYGHFRPDLIHEWATEQSNSRPVSESEKWQRELWRLVADGVDTLHPALELAHFEKSEDGRKELSLRYAKLIVLGAGTLDPMLVRVLSLLGDAGSEVIVHAVLPSLGFLSDLRGRQSVPPVETDLEEFVLPSDGHPLLRSMGRQSIGAFALLGELDEQYSHWPVPDDVENRDGSVLGQIQADVQSVRDPLAVEADAGDRSISVHSCYGPRREMEAAKDEILRAFSEIPDLQPDEIHIVTPDLETYAPLVQGVMSHGEPGLPVVTSESLAGETSDGLDAVLEILQIVMHGRFEASEVLNLLRFPEVSEALHVSDSDLLRRRIIDSGWTHGLGDDRVGKSTFSRNRLLAGRWLGGLSDAREATYPDGSWVLPSADDLGGDVEVEGRFHDWLLALEDLVASWSDEATAVEWAGRLRGLTSEGIIAGTDIEITMQPLIAFLGSIRCKEPLEAGAILDWLLDQREQMGHRRRFSGQIAFGRFKQFQNLPCRVLIMVGMQHGNFPAANRTPSWDLLRERPKIWDRNPRLDDRQLFLDAVLAPTDRLIITASTMNPRTNKREPFSSCVDDLLRVMSLMGYTNSLEHPLQPFAPAYFNASKHTEDISLSYSRNYSKVAQQLAEDVEGECRLWVEEGGEPGSAPGKELISVEKLAQFWKDPAGGFLKAAGIRMPWEEPVDSDYDRSPLQLDGLQRWNVKNRIVSEIQEPDPKLTLLKNELAAGRELPIEGLGNLEWEANTEVSEALGKSVKSARGDEVRFEWDCNSSAVITGKLLQNIECTHWLGWRIGDFESATHYLSVWISALLGAACGESRPVHLFDTENVVTPKEYYALDAKVASQILETLVSGFLKGRKRPLRFAPETSHTIVRSLAKTNSDDDAILAASKQWYKIGYTGIHGEGQQPAARLAWRDIDPFDKPNEWLRLAREISAPLAEWGGVK